jgi:hypothetical protein
VVYDRGSPLLGYKVLIMANDGTYLEEASNCDGSDSAIMAATTCTIPAIVLNSSPFDLPWGSTLYVKVLAYNDFGDSLDSLISDVEFIRKQPDSPVLAEDLSLRTSTSFTLEWDEPFNGGAQIIDYRLSFDQSTGVFVTLDGNILETSY